VSSAFRSSSLARWEESLVLRVVNDLIDGFGSAGCAELVQNYTFPFPAKVIAGVLGLPEADYVQFQEWAVGIINVATDYQRALDSAQELREYLSDIVEDRRGRPHDDLVTGR
jgi:cytochrome P450